MSPETVCDLFVRTPSRCSLLVSVQQREKTTRNKHISTKELNQFAALVSCFIWVWLLELIQQEKQRFGSFGRFFFVIPDWKKQDVPNSVTDEGMVIVVSDEQQAKALSPIFVTVDGRTMLESDLQLQKSYLFTLL